MNKIPIEPWENMNLITNAVMAGAAFSYLENNFKNIYELFVLEKEQILKKHKEEGDRSRHLEVSIYQDLFIILAVQ